MYSLTPGLHPAQGERIVVVGSYARHNAIRRLSHQAAGIGQSGHQRPGVHRPPNEQLSDERPGADLHERPVLPAGDWAVYQRGYDCAGAERSAEL